MKELRVRVKHRYYESDLWQAINPILQPGEMGIESDTGKAKYGDGKRTWKQLNYAYGSGVTRQVFDGYDNEKTGSAQEQTGDFSDPSKVFKVSLYPPADHPGEIIIVPRQYNIPAEKDKEGNVIAPALVEIIDTPYISLRKNGSWYWTVFSDQSNKPLSSSELGFFQLNVSQLG